MDIYSLRGQEDKIKDLKQELKEIKKDLISVVHVDADELEERRADLEQLLYNLKIEVDHLAGAKEEKLPSTVSGVTSTTQMILFYDMPEEGPVGWKCCMIE